jgi:hypothetical protein
MLLGLSALPHELVDIVGTAAPGEKTYMNKVDAALMMLCCMSFIRQLETVTLSYWWLCTCCRWGCQRYHMSW